MASFFQQFRGKRGKSTSAAGGKASAAAALPQVGPARAAAARRGGPAAALLSESARSLQSSSPSAGTKAATARLSWGRRRARREGVGGGASVEPAAPGGGGVAARSDAATPPPATPDKGGEGPALPESPGAGSAATTASPSTAATASPPSSDGEESGAARYVPYVPEEDVEAVRRVLLAPGDGNGAEASPRGEEGELGDDGGGGGGDEEDGASSWNAVAHAAAALDRAGRELFAAGDYDAAFLRYERALVLKRSSLGTKQQQRQGEQQDGEPPKAEPSRGPPPSAADGTSARAGQQQQQQPQPRADVVASVATSINNLTYLRQRAGLLSADESLAGYLRSLQMKREALGPGHLGVGRTLNNVGSAFYLKKEYGPALRAYTDARDILEASLGPDHGDVGTVASNIGDACLALGRRAEALERYRAALRIRWAALGPSDARVERLMQRVAALETGAQPERGGDESESDTDECLGAGGTEALFKEDIHALQEELEEDMKYFDLLERDMALNMLKDKMRIFREMRELSNDSSESDFSAEAAAPEQAIPSPSPGGAKGYADSDGGKPAVPPVSENPPGGPPARPRSRSEAGAEEGRAARRPESRAALTREDRDRALRSVRERLAGLRAGRQCLSESSGDDLRAMAGSVDLLSASDAGEPLPASPAPTSPARVSTTLSARHGAAAQE